MAWTEERLSADGKTRYTGKYRDLRGRKPSAGTFDDPDKALAAAVKAEAEAELGRPGDPMRGRQKFGSYVEKTWWPQTIIAHSTRQNYGYLLPRYILPFFGEIKMRRIFPETVREWVAWMVNQGAPPSVIQKCKRAILNSIFTMALDDGVITVHPSIGVKTPPVPTSPRKIITPEQFDAFYQALPVADAQLLVETDIESGLRWGELTELRPKDLDFKTRILTVSRAVVELTPENHPTGGRFLVKKYPKDEEYRQFKLSAQIVSKLDAHVKATDLSPEDLLFSYWDDGSPAMRKERAVPDPAILGLTKPNAQGRQYRHGSLTAYSTGGCRCEHCKEVYRIYRAERRGAGRDKPRKRRIRETDGHIPADWFRRQVWNKALAEAGLEGVTPHALRHAHASWLLAGGADLQVVKERLGHRSISTTEKYLHSLPNADEKALDALAKVRRATPESPADNASDLREQIAQLERTLGSFASKLDTGSDADTARSA